MIATEFVTGNGLAIARSLRFGLVLLLGEVVLREQPIFRTGSRGATPVNLAAAGFLAIAIALGGGGSPAPLPELILELLAALFVLVCVFAPPVGLDWHRVPKSAWEIAALVAAVPILQLIPLPPLIWHALPSRELEIQALALIGEQDTWRTWSLAPSRTLASLLSLAPPLLLLLLTTALDRSGRYLHMAPYGRPLSQSTRIRTTQPVGFSAAQGPAQRLARTAANRGARRRYRGA